jgi:hypothetical protein
MRGREAHRQHAHHVALAACACRGRGGCACRGRGGGRRGRAGGGSRHAWMRQEAAGNTAARPAAAWGQHSGRPLRAAAHQVVGL